MEIVMECPKLQSISWCALRVKDLKPISKRLIKLQRDRGFAFKVKQETDDTPILEEMKKKVKDEKPGPTVKDEAKDQQSQGKDGEGSVSFEEAMKQLTEVIFREIIQNNLSFAFIVEGEVERVKTIMEVEAYISGVKLGPHLRQEYKNV